MKLLICIDDTDNLESKGTGEIAEEIRDMLKSDFNAKPGFVTRHQLLIHKDIPYTSHNSSMCFNCELDEDNYSAAVDACCAYLKAESAEGSDPGIAVVDINNVNSGVLIDYGKSAKRCILTKSDAHAAAEAAGVFAAELGGTGDGIIGALAGAGLRLWGEDGVRKGKLKRFVPGESYSVSELLFAPDVQAVCFPDGTSPSAEETVVATEKVKPAMVHGKLTILVEKKDGVLHLFDKERLKNYGGETVFSEGCALFTPDVPEERIDDTVACFNCRYRRRLEKGLLCMKKTR